MKNPKCKDCTWHLIMSYCDGELTDPRVDMCHWNWKRCDKVRQDECHYKAKRDYSNETGVLK